MYFSDGVDPEAVVARCRQMEEGCRNTAEKIRLHAERHYGNVFREAARMLAQAAQVILDCRADMKVAQAERDRISEQMKEMALARRNALIELDQAAGRIVELQNELQRYKGLEGESIVTGNRTYYQED